MTLSSSEKRLFKSPHIFASHTKLRKLKSEQLQIMGSPREQSHRQNLYFFSSNDRADNAVPCGKIFNEGCVLRKAGLQLFERKICGSPDGGGLPLVRRQFAQSSHKLFFMRLSLCLQTLESLAGFFFGTKLLKFDAVVVPIEFLAQIPDSADKIALTRFTQGKTLPALKYHFDHAARFGGFHAGEGFFLGSVCSIPRNVQIHKRFVDLHSVFDKRYFQLFCLQSAAQGFQRFPCFQVGLMRRTAVVASLRNLPFKQVRLVSKHGRLQAIQPGEGVIRFLLCFCRVSHLEGDPREQQVSEDGFAGERRLIEERGGRSAEPPRFKVTSFMEEQQALV